MLDLGFDWCQLQLCVCLFFVYLGKAEGWLLTVGCERGRLWVVGEWPCTWVGCRQWVVDAVVMRVLLLMCYLCVFVIICVCVCALCVWLQSFMCVPDLCLTCVCVYCVCIVKCEYVVCVWCVFRFRFFF